jgi:molybdopterin synthase catalytic subunit
MAMRVRAVEARDEGEWLRMRCALWPEQDAAGHLAEMEEVLGSGALHGIEGGVLVAEDDDGGLCGFVELSIKPMDGFETGPVAYVEGWYVDEGHRRRGIGRKLLAGAERWALKQGCAEIGSGCYATNTISHAGHLACGFEEIRDEIFFRKRLREGKATRRRHAAPVNEMDWIGLCEGRLDVSAAVGFVSDARCGGIDVFLGMTRAETDREGRELVALDYEAYAAMAEKQLRELAKRAREKWPVVKLAILHQTGRVRLGEASVVIAVATPHRADAFEACRWLIDQLKVDVAIWKKEVWEGGTGTWVHPEKTH